MYLIPHRLPLNHPALFVLAVDLHRILLPDLLREVLVGAVVHAKGLLPLEGLGERLEGGVLVAVRLIEQEAFHLPVLGADPFNVDGVVEVAVALQLSLELGSETGDGVGGHGERGGGKKI